MAIVNEGLTKRFWPNESPIGRRIRYGKDWLSIVGVCGNIKHARLDAASDMEPSWDGPPITKQRSRAWRFRIRRSS